MLRVCVVVPTCLLVMSLSSSKAVDSEPSLHASIPPAASTPALSTMSSSFAAAFSAAAQTSSPQSAPTLSFPAPSAPPSSSSSVSSASQSSARTSPLHITALRVLDVIVACSRGVMVKRGLLQARTPSPPASLAGGTPGTTPTPSITTTPGHRGTGGADSPNATAAGSGVMISPPSLASVRSQTQPTMLTSSTASDTGTQSPIDTPPLAAQLLASASNPSSAASSTSSTSSAFSHTISPVLVKSFSTPNPTDEQVTRMRFEFMAFQRLPIELGRPLALVSHEEEGLCLLYEDVRGETIDNVLYDNGRKLTEQPTTTTTTTTTTDNNSAAFDHTRTVSIVNADSIIAATQSPHSPSPPAVVSSHAKTLRPLSYILRIARSLANFLLRLHDQHVIYKSIRPSTILFNADTDRCLLLEYQSSSLLSRERAIIEEWTEDGDPGLLAYISPEQTGRMNRVLDSRTDIYSLGMVMYELLVGQPPFVSSDPLEIIHFHLAKACPDPVTLLDARRRAAGDDDRLNDRERKALGWLGAIILKCVAKQAEDRYQSAAGLLSDLDFCHKLLMSAETEAAAQSVPASISPLVISRSLTPDSRSSSSATSSLSAASITSPLAQSMSPTSSPTLSSVTTSQFHVGRTDVLSRFRISQRLYGREEQVKTLLDAFDRVSGETQPTTPSPSGGPPRPIRPELVLIAGYSGIGQPQPLHTEHSRAACIMGGLLTMCECVLVLCAVWLLQARRVW